jgi:arylsulfatase A-like enzyme
LDEDMSMKIRAFFCAVVAGLGMVVNLGRAAAPAVPAAAKPNVLFIITDDLGYNDFGFQGAKDIKTPHLDALAKGGVRLTNAYVTAPVCGASRAGLLTGRYQQRHSFEDTPLGNVGLNVNESTIADAFRAGGYKTGIVGKWSVGSAEQYRPLVRGFDEFFGFLGMLHPYVPGGPIDPKLGTLLGETPRPGFGGQGRAPAPRDGPPIGNGMVNSPGNFIGNNPGKFVRGNQEVDEPAYSTDAFTREAIDFMTRHKNEPFFLYLSHNASHSPLQPPKKYLDMYPDLKGKRQMYAATTTALDDSMRDVMVALRQLGLEEKTLIVFINDNGGAIDDIGADNSPLGGAKFQLWEGGIRVPMFAYWKGRIREGVVLDQPVISLDLFPTFIAATGIPKPNKELEGIDLMPILTSGKNDPAQMERPLYWRSNALMAVRKGKWKLTLPQAGVASPLLFDLSTDIGEDKNVAAENPQVVAELTELWNKWNAANQPVGAGRGGAGRGAPGAGRGVAPGAGRGVAPGRGAPAAPPGN